MNKLIPLVGLWLFFGTLASGMNRSSDWASRFAESRLHDRLRDSSAPRPDVWSASRGATPEVALYVGKGSWNTGKEHMKWFMQDHGVSYRTITADEVLNGELQTSGVKMLMMPGGESWEYRDELGEKGAEQIRRFVYQGGGYFGVCAGAFYAVSRREGGPVTGPYGIGLLDGTAYDGTSLGTAPFKEGMLDFDVTTDAMMQGLRPHYRSVLLGGPSFHYTTDEAQVKGIRVLMRYQQIGEPAMILLNYGEGRVFLSGPHLEVEENRTDWGPDYYDPESEWPLMERVVHYLIKDGRQASAVTALR